MSRVTAKAATSVVFSGSYHNNMKMECGRIVTEERSNSNGYMDS